MNDKISIVFKEFYAVVVWIKTSAKAHQILYSEVLLLRSWTYILNYNRGRKVLLYILFIY